MSQNTPTPDHDQPADQDVEALVAAADRRRPVWLLPTVGLLALALVAGLLWLLGRGGSEPASAGNDTAPAKAGAARTIEQIRSSGQIRIGVFSDKAPFGSVDANGKYVGYDIVYAERIAKDLGVKLELVPVEAAARVEFLSSGKVDIILANFTVTEERKQKVDFANPYMKVSLGLVSPKDAPITDLAQLKDKKTIIVKGTTAEAYLTKEHPELPVTSFEQYTEATNALLDGRGAAWITDNTEALAFALQNKERFVASIPTLGPQDTIAPAVQKGNDSVRTWLNQHQLELAKESFFHKDFEATLKPAYGTAAKAEDLVIEGGKA